MQIGAFDQYPRRVLRVLLVLKQLERVKKYATYDGLAAELGKDAGEPVSRKYVYQAVLRARRQGLVESVESSSGGQGKKAVFGLTEKGRAVVE